MLYIQVTQVLMRRPKRGRLFWSIVFYSTGLFPLTTIAFLGKFRFMEKMYVDLEAFDAAAYITNNSAEWSNVMSQIWYGFDNSCSIRN